MNDTFTTSTAKPAEWNGRLLDAIADLKERYKVATKITVSREFLGRLLENVEMIKTDGPAMAQLYGIPLVITDDPLAPDYSIDYEDEDIFKFMRSHLGVYPPLSPNKFLNTGS